MPKTEQENIIFLLQCLASATQTGGKIDFKAIGSLHHSGATGNAMYLRLNRVKNSVGFTDATTTTGTTPNTPSNSHATTAPASSTTAAAAAGVGSSHPYAPTAPASKAKNAAPTGTAAAKKGSGKKRKLVDVEVEGEGQGEDGAGEDGAGEDVVHPGFAAVNKVAVTKGQEQKQKAKAKKTQKERRAEELLAGIDMKAVYEAAAAKADAECPIPDVQHEEGEGDAEMVGGDEGRAV